MHLHLLHSLHDPVDSRGTQDDWNPGGKPAGVIQDKNDLLFIIVGHVFDLNPHQGEAPKAPPVHHPILLVEYGPRRG